MKLRKLVSESWLNEPQKLSKEEKKAFLDEVSNYGSFGKAIYNKNNLIEIAKKLMKLSEQAEIVALTEVDESFDQLTVKRNMKEIKNLCKEFAKCATETQQYHHRLASLYEEIGQQYGRYFDIKSSNDDEISEEVKDMLDVRHGQDPYDGSNATSAVKEVIDQQRVDKNMGTLPYDGWKSSENQSNHMNPISKPKGEIR